MSVDTDLLLELLKEEDFNDYAFFEKVAKKMFSSGDRETARAFLKKLQFVFLSNNEGFRTKVLEKLWGFFKDESLEQLCSFTSDSVVGNYFLLYALLRKMPIINANSIGCVVDIVPQLEKRDDVCNFGFPFVEQVLLQLDERVKQLPQNDIDKLLSSLTFLFQIDFLRKTKELVEGFQLIFEALDNMDLALRANLIATSLRADLKQFSATLGKFSEIAPNSEEEIAKNYDEIWKCLEKLSLPVYFDVENLRYNGVVFNDNFYFLKYIGMDGLERIVFPFNQVEFSGVSKIYDPSALAYFTPKERYGRLLLRDVYSFRDIKKVDSNGIEAMEKIKLMKEDDIDDRIRQLLGDVNKTHHSPVEIVDVLTQYLLVNNSEDLRWAGFITKGESFGCVHLKDIGHQILKACLSPIKMVFLIHISRIDDEAIRYFIDECESKRKQYCVVNCKEIAKLFIAYKLI